MLLVFNFDWDDYGIDRPLRAAQAELDSFVAARGGRDIVVYDLASPGAGERVFWKRTPPEKHHVFNALDQFRQKYSALREGLEKDPAFQARLDMARMFESLSRDGHLLTAVTQTTTGSVCAALRRARLHDYFGARVYGHDAPGVPRKTGLAGVYEVAVARNMANPTDARLRVADDNVVLIYGSTPEGLKAGQEQEVPLIAYVSPQTCPAWEFESRVYAMMDAGAQFLATNTAEAQILPYVIHDRPRRESADVLVARLKNALNGKGAPPGPAPA